MFHVEKQGSVDVIICGGPLNEEHIEDFREAVDPCFVGQPKIVLDLGDVPMVDSRGLESLLDIQDELESLGAAVKLAAMGQVCRDTLRATGVGERFETFETVKSAIGSFSR